MMILWTYVHAGLGSDIVAARYHLIRMYMYACIYIYMYICIHTYMHTYMLRTTTNVLNLFVS
jgi:hypothetical protein